MKIVMVAPYFEPAVGGVENYLLQIVRRLSRTSEVVVVTAGLDGRRSTRVDERWGYRVEALPVDLRVFNTPVARRWPGMLRDLVARERPHVVNGHMPVPGLADVAARVVTDAPFVLTYYNDVVKPGPASIAVRGYYSLSGRGTIRRASRLICMSPEYVAQSPHLDPSAMEIDYVPPGVDTERMAPSPTEHLDPTVLFVGNLDLTHFHKGLDVLLQAVARLPSARLVVVGRGDGESTYRRLAADLGIAGRVDFRGFVSDDDLPSVFRSARVTVLPSTSAAEGFGMVLLESQASGTPVVGTRVGGIPAALDEGSTGLLVQPGSVDALASALERVLTSDALYRRLRAACRPFAERFSWDAAARRTEEVYEKALRPKVVEVSALYPPELGGLEKVCATYAEGLAARGWPVRVVTSRPGRPSSAQSSPAQSSPAQSSPAQSSPAQSSPAQLSPPLPAPPGGAPPATPGSLAPDVSGRARVVRTRRFDVGGMPVIPGMYRELVCANRPAVFHVHLSQAGVPELALIAARRRGIPVVIHFHLDVAPSGRFGPIFSAYKRWVLPRSLRAADRIVCFSSDQADFLTAKYGVAPGRLRTVPNGVEPLDAAVRPRSFRGCLRVLFVGRLAPQKRVDVLLDALASLPDDVDVEARIVGSGPLAGELAAQAERHGGRVAGVEFTGRLDGDALAGAYRWADVFVLPSEREGMPLALLEAMSAGLVCVASDAPGIRDFVTDGQTGLLFRSGAAGDLAAELARLAGDADLCRRLSAGGRAWAAEHTWDGAVTRLEGVLGEVLTVPVPGPP